MTSLYDTDFVVWSEKTAQLIRDRNFDQVDWGAVQEEIESLGRSDKRALRSQVTRVVMHMLKWDYQPQLRSQSWRLSILQGRREIAELLEDSPSLAAYLDEILIPCYQKAIKEAAEETGLPIKTFPADCPYTVIEVLSAQ